MDSPQATRRCSKCSNEFPLDSEHFRPESRCADGYERQCRSCVRAHSAQWARDNRETKNAARRAKRAADPVGAQADRRRYYLLYREKNIAYTREWQKKNRDWLNAYTRARYANGPVFITMAEAARRLETSGEAVRLLVQSGELTRIRRGDPRRVWLRAADVAALPTRRAKNGQGHGDMVELDAPFADGHARAGVIADPGARDPEAEAVARAGAEAVVDRVKAVLTDKQRRVLDAMVACDLDDGEAARECGMRPDEVRRYMACIQRRALTAFGGPECLP